MSNEAENLEPDHVPLDAFDLLPETERRQRLLKQWTDGPASLLEFGPPWRTCDNQDDTRPQYVCSQGKG